MLPPDYTGLPTDMMDGHLVEELSAPNDVASSAVDFEDHDQMLNSFTSPTRSSRQQTVPLSFFVGARTDIACTDEVEVSRRCDNIVLRVKGTFMEAVEVSTAEPRQSRHRSWSDGDLAHLAEVVEGLHEDLF